MSQNKTIPGAYINFVSAAAADAALSERGVVATILPIAWHVGEVLHVTQEEFVSRAEALFGYTHDDSALLPIREMLCEAHEVVVSIPGDGLRAGCAIANARGAGELGNEIKIEVSFNTGWSVSNPVMDVSTYYKGELKETQYGVIKPKDNDFVAFTAAVTEENTYQLAGGMTYPVFAYEYQLALDMLESERFHVLACDTTDTSITELLVNFTKRMRDAHGVKFQTVLYQQAADHEGIVNVTDDRRLVNWVAGALAGCGVHESLTNARYTGELSISPDATQVELAAAVERGEFVFHRVGSEVRVLIDCNSSVSSSLLGSNQIVRVLDQIANDIAVLFRDQYLGKIQNNAAGRLSFWSDVVRQHKELVRLGAIEEFTADDITVEAGADKSAVVVTDRVTPIGSMTKLYMTVTVV